MASSEISLLLSINQIPQIDNCLKAIWKMHTESHKIFMRYLYALFHIFCGRSTYGHRQYIYASFTYVANQKWSERSVRGWFPCKCGERLSIGTRSRRMRYIIFCTAQYIQAETVDSWSMTIAFIDNIAIIWAKMLLLMHTRKRSSIFWRVNL